MDKDLKDFLDKKFDNIDKNFAQVDEKIDKKMEEVIHRFQIITESLEDKVQQVAEGVVNLNEKFDRRLDGLDRKIDEKHQDLLAAIKFSYAELDRRILFLETEMQVLRTRVEEIEKRIGP
jgi:polyhydroxyalkanoate synthesis regulator phasin